MHPVGSALVLALAASAVACGKVQTFTDAATDPNDADELDAISAGTVTVTTYARGSSGVPAGQVVSGIDVVVIAPDGSVRDADTTDGSGEAILDVQRGDSVTVVYRDVSGGELVTFLAVAPGDHLRFGERFGTRGTQTGTMTMSWPLLVASGFEVHHPCGYGYGGGTQSSTTIFEYQDCAQSPFDALFVAYDLNNSDLISRWGLLQDVPFTNGTAATLNTWQTPGTFTLGVSGIGAAVVEADLQAQPLINGQPGPDIRLNAAPSGGMVQATRPWATGGDGIVASAGFFRDGGFGPQGTFERLPASATQWQPDDPVRLPWFGPIIASAAARQVSWITGGTGSFDATLLFMSWDHFGSDGGISNHRWTFFVPPGVDELRLPELPGTLMPYLPGDDDYPYVFGFMLDYADDAGYDALRARAEWEIGPFGGLPEGQLWLSISPNIDRIPPTHRPALPAWTHGPVLAP